MHNFYSLAVAGLLSASSTLVAARPMAPMHSYGYNGHNFSTPTSNFSKPVNPPTPSGFVFPLQDGFPNPNSDEITDIQERAHGTLPIAASNAPPAPPAAADDITSLQLISLNEKFEVAFFTELIENITMGVPGYEVPEEIGTQTLLDALTAVQAQEELHAVNADNALRANGVAPIEPCTFVFPVTTLDEAIALAATFTDVVLGTLQDVEFLLVQTGNKGLARGVASVIGQEGEQNGFYRFFQNKIPSAQPFLTTSVRDFAFTAIQSFTVPGSCPNIDTIPLQTFLPLTLVSTPVAGVNQKLQFSIDISGLTGGYSWDSNTAALVLINGQNAPVVEQIDVIQTIGTVVVFEADFAQADLLLDGLTIAAVTKSSGPFATADDVAKDTIFAPGLIEVN